MNVVLRALGLRKAKAKKAEPTTLEEKKAAVAEEIAGAASKDEEAEAIAWARAEVSKPDAEPILTYSEEEDGPLGDLFED